MAGEQDARYASEVQQFLALFQAVGTSVAGLLILEIGWTLVLILASSLNGDQGHGPTVTVPWLTGLVPPRAALYDVPSSTVWVVGSLLVVAGWVVHSRLYVYAVSPSVIVIKPIVDGLFWLMVLLAVLLDAVLWPLLWLPRRWLAGWKLRRDREAWVRRQIERTGQPEAEARAAYDDLAQAVARKRPTASFEARAEEAARRWTDVTGYLVRGFSRFLVTPLHANLRIGLAPVGGVRGPGGLIVAGSALEQFGTAIVAVNTILRDVEAADRVRLSVLPTGLVVSSDRRADFFRRLLDLDLLLWARRGDDPSAIEAFASCRTAADGAEDLFPEAHGSSGSGLWAARFDPRDQAECCALLLAGVLRALRARGGRPRRWMARWDRVGNSAGPIAEQVERRLALDVLPILGAEPEPASIVPSVRAVVAATASRWAGRQLTSWAASGLDSTLWRSLGRVRVIELLSGVLERCSRVEPARPEHLYRRTAVAVLAGDHGRARRLAERAWALDRSRADTSESMESARATTALIDADAASGLEADLAFARFAAYAVRALGSGDELDAAMLAKSIRTSKPVAFARAVGRPPPPPVQFVEDLIFARDGRISRVSAETS